MKIFSLISLGIFLFFLGWQSGSESARKRMLEYLAGAEKGARKCQELVARACQIHKEADEENARKIKEAFPDIEEMYDLFPDLSDVERLIVYIRCKDEEIKELKEQVEFFERELSTEETEKENLKT